MPEKMDAKETKNILTNDVFKRINFNTEDPPTALDFLENFFSHSLNKELSKELTRINITKLKSFFKLLRKFYDNYTIKAPENNNTRVYLNITSGDVVSIVDNIVWSIGFRDRDSFLNLWPQVLKYILYCSEVCILDPLSAVCNSYHNYFRKDHRFTEQALRQITISAVEFIIQAEPFVRRGIIHLIPYEISNDIWKFYCDNKDEIDSSILADYEYRKTYRKFWSYSGGEGFRINSLYLNSRILIASAINADFLGQSLWASEMYETLLKIGCKFASQNSVSARHFGSIMEKIDLPILSKLNSKDLLSIRLNEDTFALWRADIGEVVRHCGIVDLSKSGNLESNVNEFNAIASEIFKKRQVEIKRVIKGSSSLRKHITDGVLGFSAGWLAQIAQSTSFEEALGKAGLSATATFLMSILFRRTKRSALSQRRLYILMSEPAGLSMSGIRII